MWLGPRLNEHDEGLNSYYVSRYKGGYIYEMPRVLMYDPQMNNPDVRFITMMRDFLST